MTFKKINKSSCYNRKRFFNQGQAIFEYFILTIAVMGVVFFVFSSNFFRGIKGDCENAFNQAVGEILR